jgi:hypothetical protein
LFPLIAVVTALAGALVFGVSSVAEHRGTQRVERRAALSPRLLLDLVRQPLWLLSIGGTLVGFALQVIALRYGALALVEPILVCGLIIAVFTSQVLRRHRDRVVVAGVVACAAGVAGFLVIARPSGGQPSLSLVSVLPVGLLLAVALAGCLAVARRHTGARALALALACGIDFGVAAFVVKLLTADFSGGLPALFGHWPLYALAIVGPLGFLLNQNAFQQGILISPVLALITACDPIVSIGLAHFWLDEKFDSSPAGIAGEIVALLLMISGIIVLAHHAPVATRQVEQAARPANAVTDLW